MIVAISGYTSSATQGALSWALNRLHADVGIHLIRLPMPQSGRYHPVSQIAAEWARSHRVAIQNIPVEVWSQDNLDGYLAAPLDILLAFPIPGRAPLPIADAKERGIRVLEYDEAVIDGRLSHLLVERDAPAAPAKTLDWETTGDEWKGE